MDISSPTPTLGGLSPTQFMRRHWQRKPLLVRGAFPGITPPLKRAALFDLAASQDVESRIVEQQAGGAWKMRRGPFARRALPPLSRPGWTLLVQGLDLHLEAAHQLLQRFAFAPQARLDDLMLSYATDGGGVGPHFDSYDVFLIQVHGHRLWRWGRQDDLSLREDVPLKILSHFEPEQEALLAPGDMLYLPPRYAHDGIAQGECMTCSVGFRAPARGELARELLQRLAEDAAGLAGDALYRDPAQPATQAPGEIPAPLQAFAAQALKAAMADPHAMARALGEVLTEPKAQVWFEAGGPLGRRARGLVLDRRTRMLYDGRHVFVNGESWRASGADARLMRALADGRQLDAAALAGASVGARALLSAWCEDGWAHPLP
ncbi:MULTISPECIES: cupin domain-containing protein [Ramlibacter]|uniref:Cupin domain-containing protein n=1 Tax=Ramlibacter aquaticus TaxID=2780094 RepID=A0ABR9SJE1_9BURK|nr:MULTISPECIES: cupin domain-containing protein [Ramlibacter]MBE7942491.1 cupin domain-containing protein [Ramlibacter aquaticus]